MKKILNISIFLVVIIFFMNFVEENYNYKKNTEYLSKNIILINRNTKENLINIKSGEKIYPASLTKIMTVLVAIENIENLNKEFVIPKNLVSNLKKKNSSMAGFQEGEKLKIIDLLYGSMLPSGGEASVGLGIFVSGSEEEFVKLMNAKAKQLNMNNTNFKNVTGLHNRKHYTTLEDLIILLDNALDNEQFYKIFTTKEYYIPETNLKPKGLVLKSTFFEKLNFSDEDIHFLGGKTGYTKEAGLCLGTLAEINNNEYILITTNAKGNLYSEQYNIEDAINIYNKLK